MMKRQKELREELENSMSMQRRVPPRQKKNPVKASGRSLGERKRRGILKVLEKHEEKKV